MEIMCLLESVSWFLANPESSLVTRSAQGPWVVQVILSPYCESESWLFLERHSFFNLLFWLLAMAFTVWQGINLSVNHSDQDWGLCSSYRSGSLEQFIKMLTSKTVLIPPAENSEIHRVTFFSPISATLELEGLGLHRKRAGGWIIFSN